jgi:hypothetical protein
MATTDTTRAKPSSVEAIVNALRQHPDATAAELAEAASIGRSTAGKTLATLEAQGRVTRRHGTSEGGKANPNRWTLVLDPAESEPQVAAVAVSVDEPVDMIETPGGAASAAAPPVAGALDPAPAEAAATSHTTSDARQPTSEATGGGPRLRPGALRALIHDWLAERPGQEFTPTRIGKELGRSAGAVGNALATMTDQGEVVQTNRKPRRYAIAEGGDQAGPTR